MGKTAKKPIDVVEDKSIPIGATKVVIIATEKSTYLVNGKEYEVNVSLARKLIGKGSAKLK